MTQVRELLPGDVVFLPGAEVSGVFITRTPHYRYPGLELVVWRLSDGQFSFDALRPDQHVGNVQPQTAEERARRLEIALEGAGSGG